MSMEKESRVGYKEPWVTDAYCFHCKSQGICRVCVLPIQYFDDIMVSSFSCENCGYEDNMIQNLKEPKEKGIHIELKIKDKSTLNRTFVRQTSCIVLIPELEFEYSPFKTQGSVSTIDSFITKCINNISYMINEEDVEKETKNKLLNFVENFKKLLTGEMEFTFILDDPSGNSFIENPFHPNLDPNMWIMNYKRTWKENNQFGIISQPDSQITNNIDECQNIIDNDSDEQCVLHDICRSCNRENEIRMQKINIPYFQEVFLSCCYCSFCNTKFVNVKSIAPICDYGVKYILKVDSQQDLNRDIIKSDYGKIKIPELELEISEDLFPGTYATIEGFLRMFREEIQKDKPIIDGDSRSAEEKAKFHQFLDKLDNILEGNLPFTFELDDPTGNSFIQNLMAPDPDPKLLYEKYKRSKLQNDFLCLEDE